MFKPSFFAGNRKELRRRVQQDYIVIASNGVLQRSLDSVFPFHQDSSFWYLTGIAVPGAVLVMAKESEYLIVPAKEKIIEIFDGATDVNQVANISGIRSVMTEKEGWEQLGKDVGGKHVAILEPAAEYIQLHGFYANPERRMIKKRLKKIKATTHDIRKDIAELRVIKQKPELMAIQAAVDITLDTLKEITLHKKSFNFEYEIEAALSAGYRKRGAAGHAFTPIVASGKNSSTIHYTSNNDALGRSEILLFDTGAEMAHYAADISRPMLLAAPSVRVRNILDALQQSHAYALSVLKPGLNYYEYELLVEKHVGRQLKKLNLITSTTRSEVRKYFPHAASHFLGLDVHDVGDRFQDLRPNMVIAVEPGIIIPQEGIGVRIEDNVAITATGYKNMSVALPVILE